MKIKSKWSKKIALMLSFALVLSTCSGLGCVMKSEAASNDEAVIEFFEDCTGAKSDSEDGQAPYFNIFANKTYDFESFVSEYGGTAELTVKNGDNVTTLSGKVKFECGTYTVYEGSRAVAGLNVIGLTPGATAVRLNSSLPYDWHYEEYGHNENIVVDGEVTGTKWVKDGVRLVPTGEVFGVNTATDVYAYRNSDGAEHVMIGFTVNDPSDRIERIVIRGDNATVHMTGGDYYEDDDENSKFTFRKNDGYYGEYKGVYGQFEIEDEGKIYVTCYGKNGGTSIWTMSCQPDSSSASVAFMEGDNGATYIIAQDDKSLSSIKTTSSLKVAFPSTNETVQKSQTYTTSEELVTMQVLDYSTGGGTALTLEDSVGNVTSYSIDNLKNQAAEEGVGFNKSSVAVLDTSGDLLMDKNIYIEGSAYAMGSDLNLKKLSPLSGESVVYSGNDEGISWGNVKLALTNKTFQEDIAAAKDYINRLQKRTEYIIQPDTIVETLPLGNMWNGVKKTVRGIMAVEKDDVAFGAVNYETHRYNGKTYYIISSVEIGDDLNNKTVTWSVNNLFGQSISKSVVINHGDVVEGKDININSLHNYNFFTGSVKLVSNTDVRVTIDGTMNTLQASRGIELATTGMHTVEYNNEEYHVAVNNMNPVGFAGIASSLETDDKSGVVIRLDNISDIYLENGISYTNLMNISTKTGVVNSQMDFGGQSNLIKVDNPYLLYNRSNLDTATHTLDYVDASERLITSIKVVVDEVSTTNYNMSASDKNGTVNICAGYYLASLHDVVDGDETVKIYLDGREISMDSIAMDNSPHVSSSGSDTSIGYGYMSAILPIGGTFKTLANIYIVPKESYVHGKDYQNGGTVSATVFSAFIRPDGYTIKSIVDADGKDILNTKDLSDNGSRRKNKYINDSYAQDNILTFGTSIINLGSIKVTYENTRGGTESVNIKFVNPDTGAIYQPDPSYEDPDIDDGSDDTPEPTATPITDITNPAAMQDNKVYSRVAEVPKGDSNFKVLYHNVNDVKEDWTVKENAEVIKSELGIMNITGGKAVEEVSWNAVFREDVDTYSYEAEKALVSVDYNTTVMIDDVVVDSEVVVEPKPGSQIVVAGDYVYVVGGGSAGVTVTMEDGSSITKNIRKKGDGAIGTSNTISPKVLYTYFNDLVEDVRYNSTTLGIRLPDSYKSVSVNGVPVTPKTEAGGHKDDAGNDVTKPEDNPEMGENADIWRVVHIPSGRNEIEVNYYAHGDMECIRKDYTPIPGASIQYTENMTLNLGGTTEGSAIWNELHKAGMGSLSMPYESMDIQFDWNTQVYVNGIKQEGGIKVKPNAEGQTVSKGKYIYIVGGGTFTVTMVYSDSRDTKKLDKEGTGAIRAITDREGRETTYVGWSELVQGIDYSTDVLAIKLPEKAVSVELNGVTIKPVEIKEDSEVKDPADEPTPKDDSKTNGKDDEDDKKKDDKTPTKDIPKKDPVNDIEDGDSFDKGGVTIKPPKDGSTVTVDGKPVTSDTTVTSPGTHKVVITNPDGTTTEKIIIVIQDHGYYQPTQWFDFTLAKEVWIDGVKQDNLKFQITAEGVHTIRVLGADGVWHEYTVTITKLADPNDPTKKLSEQQAVAQYIKGVTSGKWYKKAKTIKVSAKATLTYKKSKKAKAKKSTFTGSKTVKKAGYYTVTCKGYKCTFGIDKKKPALKGIKNKAKYKRGKKVKAKDSLSGVKKMQINKKTYKAKKAKKGIKLKKSGKYTIKVWDKAGNKRTYKIRVK